MDERSTNERSIDKLRETENADYLRGYRDGIRDRRSVARPASGDGILGALLAISLIAGVGYFGYNYATTGSILPARVDLTVPLPDANRPQP